MCEILTPHAMHVAGMIILLRKLSPLLLRCLHHHYFIPSKLFNSYAMLNQNKTMSELRSSATPLLCEDQSSSSSSAWPPSNEGEGRRSLVDTDRMTMRLSSSSDCRRNNGRTCVRNRRNFKSSLYFAFASILYYCCFISTTTIIVVDAFSMFKTRSAQSQQWIERSVQYYSTVMRKNTNSGNIQTRQHDYALSEDAKLPTDDSYHHDKEFVVLATKHYYARFLIKMGKWDVAEKIYRRIIDELTADPSEGNCDHTKLAVSTLLLALHMQRTGDIKATRAVFLNFFRRVALTKDDHSNNNDDAGSGSSESVHKCSCSAKVLQAFALFEMKNGLSAKSLEIIQLAVQMDEQLSPVLEWKQFRDAAAGVRYSPTFTFRKQQMKSKEKGGLSP